MQKKKYNTFKKFRIVIKFLLNERFNLSCTLCTRFYSSSMITCIWSLCFSTTFICVYCTIKEVFNDCDNRDNILHGACNSRSQTRGKHVVSARWQILREWMHATYESIYDVIYLSNLLKMIIVVIKKVF